MRKKRESLAKQASTTRLALKNIGTQTIIRSQVFEYRYILALAYPGLQEKQHVSFFAENSKSKPVCYY